MNEGYLISKVRNVTEEDRKKLPTFSYSKMDVFKNCPFQYNKKYNEGMYTSDTSIALELGSLCHYVLEQKGKMIVSGQEIDYGMLQGILQNGVTVTDEKTKEQIPGVIQLKKKYFDIWWENDNASGMTYEEKMLVFDKVLHKEMEDDDWIPAYFELPFEFVWDNRVIIKGFIDRIDTRNGDFRTVDYKTSKKVYDSSKLATSLQFGIYALAILTNFGVLPTESKYRFILLDNNQYALTKGWEKRLIKALDKIFDQIDDCEQKGLWKPNPTPLCHWCNFCKHNPDAHEFKDECEYFSLWTPVNKSFAVNKEWNPEEIKSAETKRKLVF